MNVTCQFGNKLIFLNLNEISSIEYVKEESPQNSPELFTLKIISRENFIRFILIETTEENLKSELLRIKNEFSYSGNQSGITLSYEKQPSLFTL